MRITKESAPYIVKLNGRLSAAFRKQDDAWEFAQMKFHKIAEIYSASVVDIYTGKELQGFNRKVAA